MSSWTRGKPSSLLRFRRPPPKKKYINKKIINNPKPKQKKQKTVISNQSYNYPRQHKTSAPCFVDRMADPPISERTETTLKRSPDVCSQTTMPKGFERLCACECVGAMI